MAKGEIRKLAHVTFDLWESMDYGLWTIQRIKYNRS